eukprot:m.1128946 g.1128946  ORF g.1128946 m.1128946 type:complete len:68 (-) comp24415_c0_seq2:3758-3961(-)
MRNFAAPGDGNDHPRERRRKDCDADKTKGKDDERRHITVVKRHYAQSSNALNTLRRIARRILNVSWS